MSDLRKIAAGLVEKGKGIMATDAGESSLKRRLAEAGIDDVTREDIRRFREVLYTAGGVGRFIGGVILRDEALKQNASDGRSFVEHLREEGIVVGVKVDKGVKDLANFGGEVVTEGLDGLEGRLEEYWALGARFTKWRAVIRIGGGRPSRQCVVANAGLLAQFAAVSQNQGMVPVVEPEVLMDGDHTIDECARVTEMVARTVFEWLADYRVDVAALIYKVNMVTPGTGAGRGREEEIAEKTVAVFKRCVAAGVPGVVFLSGGQGAEESTRRLNEIARVGRGVPWRWSFSFERAFEEPVMQVWKGRDENKTAAQAELLKRAEENSLASLGKYTVAGGL